MASKSNRQRRLERARTERRLAKRAEQVRRKRRVQAAVGGSLALILLILGTTWVLGGFDSKPDTVALPECTWTPKQPGEGVIDTGLPPSTVDREGVKAVTIQTNLGDINAVIDLSRAACAAASLEFLAGQGYYDGTRCHHLDQAALTLTCGSKDKEGTSGPSYQFPAEGVPPQPVGTVGPAPAGASPAPSVTAGSPSYYLKGSIVMANSDVNATGAQFFIVYGDGTNLAPQYTQIATITDGLEYVAQIAAGGAVDATGATALIGNPVRDLTITKIGIADELSINPSDAAATETTPAPSASS